jgi:hypothetical protein
VVAFVECDFPHLCYNTGKSGAPRTRLGSVLGKAQGKRHSEIIVLVLSKIMIR